MVDGKVLENKMVFEDKYGIIPSSGVYGKDWPANSVIPQGSGGKLSTAGWTADSSGNFGNEGFVQQTFLGASIRTFNLSAGFGDTSSTMTIDLVNDEYNESDGTGIGEGDDPYHNGKKDTFNPPVVGTPVFFKFGKNPATIEQAFRQTYDDLYKTKTLPDKGDTDNPWGYNFPVSPYDPNDFAELEPYHLVDLESNLIQDRSKLWEKDTVWRGRNHFAFGGILQSYTQNKGEAGAPLFSVTLNDPREILSNVDVLLNNYQGTTFNNKNIINLYGFLEYDPSVSLLESLNLKKLSAGIIKKVVSQNGTVQYIGADAAWNSATGWEVSNTPANVTTDSITWQSENYPEFIIPSVTVNLKDQYYFGSSSFVADGLPEFFPITGQGFSRRSSKGMPFYRISQGLAAIFQYYGFLPQEYKDAGFGGQINFRGYNYVVDFSGIPTDKIPLSYYMDFDKIDLLSLAQELCDIISHELYVSLLPVIDHPASKFLHDYNEYQVSLGTPENMIVGIIRLDAIDKTKQPEYGVIKSYLDNLQERGVTVQNQDVGFELSNVVTDKFVVGAQEVDMHFFSSSRDRDDLWKRENNIANLQKLQSDQWQLTTQLQQQILPYYGKLGNNAVSVPRGFGSYQQILLDATELNAFGVGNYYVATEIELRAALISYEAWVNFLLSYNDVYIEDIAQHSTFLDSLSAQTNEINDAVERFKGNINFDTLDSEEDKAIINEYLEALKFRKFAVTVPRCVFASDRPYMTEAGYPASPCSPPFGYPLYYKRATRIGVVRAGIANILQQKTKIISDIEKLKSEYESQYAPPLNISKKSASTYLMALENKRISLIRSYTNSANPDAYKGTKKYQDLMKAIAQAKRLQDSFFQIEQRAKEQGLDSIVADITEGPLSSFMFNIENTARKHEENAKKVYEFVKKIADECLGKKFLVRLPKSCNLNYSPTIKMYNGQNNSANIQSGPFGFQPRPISSDPSFVSSFEFTSKINQIKSSRAFGGDSLFHHYLEDYDGDGNRITLSNNYNNGALKGNYNPFSEEWEWNYKPEPKGGFYNYNLFGSSISELEYLNNNISFNDLPVSMQEGLCPIDIKKITSETNRIKCYARYDNSHLLDFTGVDPENMTQQSVTLGGQFVPDIVDSLPNNNIDSETSFQMIDRINKNQRSFNTQQKSMAFVSCEVDEKLYMPPKLENKSRTVWGCDYEVRFSLPSLDINTRFGSNSCDTSSRVRIPLTTPIFSVPADGGPGESENWIDFKRNYNKNLDGLIIDTNKENLDDEHVYTLVTVPGRIKSTVDIRWKDGPMQAYHTVQKKHLMTQDVVKIPQFRKPAMPASDNSANLTCGKPEIYATKEEALREASRLNIVGYHERPTKEEEFLADEYNIPLPEEGFSPGSPEDWVQISTEEITSARRLNKKVLQGFVFSSPETSINITSPSPIFPDIVAIPLMSMERCYGPWLSSSQLDPSEDARIKYSNIGGKVEFIKDETLSPWEYAGYQLLNEAGSLQANFSNSLLLFSERGGFVIPDAPTGVALATALQEGGPIITSIGVNVSDAGVSTTVKMDLYTSQFGKLQKQKEMAISQIARERQKLTDERNNAVRKGLGKRATSADLVTTVMEGGGKQLLSKAYEVSRLSSLNANQEPEGRQLTIIDGNDINQVSEKELRTKLETFDGNESTNALERIQLDSPVDNYQPASELPSTVTPSFMPYNPFSLADRILSSYKSGGQQ